MADFQPTTRRPRAPWWMILTAAGFGVALPRLAERFLDAADLNDQAVGGYIARLAVLAIIPVVATVSAYRAGYDDALRNAADEAA
jgi:hypothetical protein